MQEFAELEQIEGMIRSKTFTRAEILQELEAKVSELLTKSGETFFQLMYRLDISEKKLSDALKDPDNGVMRIALLIYERQTEKASFREKSQNNKKPGDSDLEW